jgi:hypothetical protein
MIVFDEENQSVGGAISVLPWEVRLYQLVSWLDMEQFAAAQFYFIGSILERMRGVVNTEIVKRGVTGKETEGAKGEITGILVDALRLAEASCSEVGLRQPLKQIARLRKDLKSDILRLEHVATSINELQDRINDEMEDHLFMHIPADRAELYNDPELFGKDVNSKFPDIQFDLVEAGNCYAAGRGTAVVFHLMRVMETGVQAFGIKLGVALADKKNWQNILDEINKAIKALPKTSQTVEMSQVSANLYAVKLAWRNEVMHPKDTYTLEEADNLIRQVKIFMQQLVTII